MNRTLRPALLLASLVTAVLLAGAAPDPQTKVPVTEVGSKFVLVGQITDQPLGTFMTVEGVADREWMGAGWPVVVDTVDGKKLAKSVRVGVMHTPRLTQGTRYVLRGFESCGMGGTPADPQAGNGEMVQQPLGFRSWFEVTRMEQPANLKTDNK